MLEVKHSRKPRYIREFLFFFFIQNSRYINKLENDANPKNKSQFTKLLSIKGSCVAGRIPL